MISLTEHLLEHAGKVLTLRGWVETVRAQKKVQFVVIRNKEGLVQIVHVRGTNPEVEQAIDQLTFGSTISVTGVVALNPAVKLGGVELVAQQLEIYSLADPMPISTDSAFEKKMDYRWIDLREPRNRLIFEVQTVIEAAMRREWLAHDFIEIHSPKLMAQASENSGAELFTLDHFGEYATLAQSPQWYKQMAMASGFDRVFEIGPVFRANPSMTSRHDTEFTSVDMEMAWINSHEDIMAFEEDWIRFFMVDVAHKLGSEIEQHYGLPVVVPSVPFPRITLEEATRIVASTGYQVPPETKGDLDPQAERILGDYALKNWGHDFVFVTGYPASVRAFYHMREESNPTTTKSFDLLYRGIEVTTGAQREHRIERLVQQARDKGLNPGSLEGYFQFFRYGVPPHGGFGFGLTRLLMKLLGLSNVRQVTYVYRGPKRLTP